MRSLALLLVLGCRMPDQVGAELRVSETDWDIDRSAGQGVSGPTYGVALIPVWLTGEHLARLREEERRGARMEAVQAAQAAQSGVVVIDHSDEGDEEPPPDDGWSTLQKSLTAAGASLVALLVGWLQVRTRKPKIEEEE